MSAARSTRNLLTVALLMVPLTLASRAASADAINIPSVCVIVDSTLAPQRRLTADDVARALRARLSGRFVKVQTCVSAQAIERATWRVRLHRDGENISLSIGGLNSMASLTVAVERLEPVEIVRLVALTTAEAVRPALDRLLRELGLDNEESEGVDRALRTLDSTADTGDATTMAVSDPLASAAVSSSNADSSSRVYARIWPGFVAGVRATNASAQVALSLGLAQGRWDFSGDIAVGPMSTAHEDPVTLRGVGYVASVSAARHLAPGRLGLSLLGRLTSMVIEDRPGRAARARLSFWDVGIALSGGVVLWHNEWLTVGMDLSARAWWQPRRFEVGGIPAASQSVYEIVVGPSLSLGT